MQQMAIPVMAVPTTSGTGSEATHFAVIYKDGVKQSIADQALLPEYVVLQPDVLKTLPLYQKKCTMLDALCQAIESWWSKAATLESICYARQAIRLILTYMDAYMENEAEGNQNMLIAAHLAGKAINITTTTAPHAMSYALTSLYGIPHGHAVALCLPKLWRFMQNYDHIAHAFGKANGEEAVTYIEELLQSLEIQAPENARIEDIDGLMRSVDAQRLSNHPMRLDESDIHALYRYILNV